MSYQKWLCSVSIVFISLFSSQNSFAFRCDGHLVTKGDSKISVLKKCGKPTWTDRWVEEIIDLPDTDFEHRIARVNERWIYNPGPTQFLRILVFRDSEVISIETGSRGFTVVPGMQRCDFELFALGTTSAEVAIKCGKPDWEEQRYELVTHKIAGGRRQISVTVDEWTFNLGPTNFMRVMTFYNGKLMDVRTGDKGFNE